MTHALLHLTDADLNELAKALKSGRVVAPFTAIGVQRALGSPHASDVATALARLAEQGFSVAQLATLTELMVQARQQRTAAEDVIDLVTTGPEAPGIANRDTSVVVRELFFHARQAVLVAGYAVYQGQQVFAALADRMEEIGDLRVRFVLDIQRGPGDTTRSDEIISRFWQRFRTSQWPEGNRLPQLFFDPRSLEMDRATKTAMHAKCIVIDRKIVFVSSANFTEAAQERNLEIGLLIRSATLADRIQAHFDSLIASGLLVPTF